MALIYIVEDDENIAELISAALKAVSYNTCICDSADELYKELEKRIPDLILLDIMLPQKSGFEIITELKSASKTAVIPVIFLSAKGMEIDKVRGLELGAEDYITKPFGILELQARVKTALRRGSKKNDRVKYYDLEIDFAAKEVYKNGEEIKLTFKEFEVLEFLYRHIGNVISREQLLENVWGYSYDGDTTRTVDMHIRSLRQKIGDSAESSKCIETVRGYGYKLRK